MQIRKMIRLLAWSAATLALALTVTACGGGDKSGPDSAAPSASASGSPSQPAAAENAEPNFLSGTFNGLIDGHSVEIETSEGPKAYQIPPEIAEKAAEWEPGAKVKFQAKDNTITAMDLE